MSTPLIIGKDINGTVSDTLFTSENIVRSAIPPATEQSTIVPSNVDTAYFAYGSGGDVWVDLKNPATLPTTGFIETTAELNPVSRFVRPNQVISFICSTENVIEVFYVNSRTRT